MDYVDTFFAEWKAQDPKGDFHDTDTEVLFRVMRLGRALDQTLTEICAPAGVTHSQFQALAALRRRYPSPITAAAIMEASVLSSGSVTSLINVMIKKGWIDRNIGETDRRTINIHLTKNGKATIDSLLKKRVKQMKSWAAALPASERKNINLSLRKLTEKGKDFA